MLRFPEVEEVKNDETRHGDTLKALRGNGEYHDRAVLPFVACGMFLLFFIVRFCCVKHTIDKEEL